MKHTETLKTKPVDVPVRAVQKAMQVLDRIALADVRREGVTLSTLAAEFAWPLNSTHNLLKTLVACGYVAQSGRGVYVAGIKCGQMRRLTQCADPVTRERLLARMQEFVNTEGEACVCFILAQGRRLRVAEVESNHAVRVAHATVEDAPFFAKASGRMLAAIADPAGLQQIVEQNGMPGKHWDGILELPALQQALAPLRKQGWCVVEDQEQDLIGLAVPIWEGDGRAWGVLGAFAPTYRCPAAKQEQLRLALGRHARELSAIIS